MLGDGTSDEDTSDDAWREVTEEFSRLGSSIRARYTEESDQEILDELRQAFTDLTQAASRVGEAARAAFQDPEVRRQAKHTISALLNAMAGTAKDLRSDLPGAKDPTRDDDGDGATGESTE